MRVLAPVQRLGTPRWVPSPPPTAHYRLSPRHASSPDSPAAGFTLNKNDLSEPCWSLEEAVRYLSSGPATKRHVDIRQRPTIALTVLGSTVQDDAPQLVRRRDHSAAAEQPGPSRRDSMVDI